ncbi:SMR family transporter [Enterobacter hormaechei]|uniref:SMR family transporter n=1 Tax=Enterobacter hormaechei TaxID=158836 RepID=UPI000F88B384|nr:SMR family transporter [Enterobacter hormaechei]RTO96182.1 QacE family quaternary ammonium compound efflux SMR transporter [Enterobacter hormaechei]
MAYIFLTFSILCEVIATTALKASDSFTKFWPSALTILFYAFAFYSLTIPMKTIPTGIIYAIWSGAGIVLIGLVSWLIQGQKLDLPAILGMLLIVLGVLVINIFSKAVSH